MGNKLVRKRQIIDERYTRPQGLYQLSKDVDHKKLRKLILESKLAPCYPGVDDRGFDLEECPICFLYYPSLNRSKCCMKGICTECFLQMKPPNSTRPTQYTQCPFCKTSNYAVEYRGVMTKEEKGMEQIEEQKVIEAKIRVRRQELLDEQERMLRRQEVTNEEIEDRGATSSSLTVPILSSMPFSVQGEEILPSQDSCAGPLIRQPVRSRQNRDEGFDLDLEDIMVMEAIWLSIQEHDTHMPVTHEELAESGYSSLEGRRNASGFSPREPSPSAGLACAIAAMAERQLMDAESASVERSNYHTGYRNNTFSESEGRSTTLHHVEENWIEKCPQSGRALYNNDAEWRVDHGSEMAEASTSHASNRLHSVSDKIEFSPSRPDLDGSTDHSIPTQEDGILPESFEEQVMLAMAISLAEAQARSSLHGPWG